MHTVAIPAPQGPDRLVRVDAGAPMADPDSGDAVVVRELLGRRPRASFAVVARDAATGAPVVIRNAPLLDDGTPMPTRYWLVDPALVSRIGTLESTGGVRQAEAEVDASELEASHRRYATDRDAAMDSALAGPRPSGGVGGTRTGVKCLHTHYAWWLVDQQDPVGAWVHQRLAG